MQGLRFLDQPLRLGEVAGGLEDTHQFAGAGLGAQVLAEPAAVVADQGIGAVQDVAEAAVVLLQLDDLLDAVLALEVRHIADPRTAEGVDALVVVTHREHGLATTRRRKHLQPGVLQLVGVLELVYQQMLEAALVMLAHRLVVSHQLEGAQHQLGEVDHAFALALVFIGLVDQGQGAGLFVVLLHIAGAQAVFLGAGDEPADLLGDVALFVQLHALDDALDSRDRVGRIEDLEALRQAGQLPVRAQEAVAQAVEGAYPHAPHVHRQHGGQPRDHLFGRLVGEGHGHHAARRNLAGLHQPGDAGGQDARLARAGAGQYQRGLRWRGDGGVLLGVQVLQQSAAGGGGKQVILGMRTHRADCRQWHHANP